MAEPMVVYQLGNECGIGALAEWNGKLYMINYAAHQPKGSEHKLYIIDQDKNMQIFEGSIGGTPAARMVHKESNQLLIGPYVIDSKGNIRVIPIKDMEGRLTAIARHLKDPENMVYYYDMEGMLYEVNVHTLAVNKLYHDPLPGWHGKGGYTSQGKLVLSNNGEVSSGEHGTTGNWKVDTVDVFGPRKNGILAEFDGENFKIVERRQYTDVTTKHGINAIPDDNSPLWAMGWDEKSVRLKVLDNGVWSTYLLPKAAFNNDPAHGWFTEWPRIRSIGNGKMMMDMHGMFYDFPKTFSASNTEGIKPMGSHLRYIPDFMNWNGQIVLATDETSIQGNPLAGQPQSNLWFGKYEDLSSWGPASGYGAIWLNDDAKGNKPSEPYLVAGFDNRIAHLENHGKNTVKVTLQIDKNGANVWEDYKTIELKPNGYNYHIFDKGFKAEWIRLVSDKDSKLTATFHYTDDSLNDGSKASGLFADIADIDYKGEVSHTKLYSNKTNYNLSVYPGKIANGEFVKTDGLEFTKFDFEFVKGIKDTNSIEALKKERVGNEVNFNNEKVAKGANANFENLYEWSEDEASIIINAKEYRLRLPKGKVNYQNILPQDASRFRRELESERELANVGGTFYELPLMFIGKEPRYKMMRPVATHNKQISEFNTWNGLLVLSGVRADAQKSEHIYTAPNGEASLWFGGIDDIWYFGKPVGEGGPWRDASVKANELSDMYIMTGYDKKTLMLKADKDVQVTLMLHVNHYSDMPVTFKTFNLKAGEVTNYEFPDGFSAHWAQLKADKDCVATAWFVYE